MRNEENILEMIDIDKYFPGVKALDKVNFSVNGEESVAYGLSQIIKTESLRSVVSSMQDINY